jgi:YHS domain-containing protein
VGQAARVVTEQGDIPSEDLEMTQLDVIFGKAGETAIDPVCKMTVKKTSPGGGTAEHEGETYYFCGPGCREAFAADPAQFLGADAADMGHMDHGSHKPA